MRVLRAWLRALADGARDENARPLYLAAGGLLATGTVFYSLVERWTILDALYFCVTTLTTVGLGDFTPQTAIGKAFTIVYVLAGIAVIVAFANAVLQRAATMRTDETRRPRNRGPQSGDDA